MLKCKMNSDFHSFYEISMHILFSCFRNGEEQESHESQSEQEGSSQRYQETAPFSLSIVAGRRSEIAAQHAFLA